MGCASSSDSKPTTSSSSKLPAYATALPTKAEQPQLSQMPNVSSLKSTSASNLHHGNNNSFHAPPPSPSHNAAATFKIDTSRATQLCQQWTTKFAIAETGGEDAYTTETVLKDVQQLLRSWPRGTDAGQLLHKPQSSPDHSPNLKTRGIKTTWLLAAWQHMTGVTKHNLCSTRMFVELLVRPLLSSTGTDCLIDYIPLAFRSHSPHVFVSHAWDGMFKHVLFYPDSLKRHWPADCGVWIDVFAMPQLDDGPNSDALDEVRDVIHGIGSTVVVFPGDGTPEFALLPVLRSWCVYEMYCAITAAANTNSATPAFATGTPNLNNGGSSSRTLGTLQFRTGLHGDLNDADFHNAILAFIDALSSMAMQASYESDDQAIRDELDGEDVDALLQQWAKAAMAGRYEAVPVTPNLARRISSNKLHRYSSLSDIYLGNNATAEQEQSRNSNESRLSIKEHPDF